MKLAPIAQLDRASDFESEGWGFDSLWVHHNADYQFLQNYFLVPLVVGRVVMAGLMRWSNDAVRGDRRLPEIMD